jgi:hypothetical protein
MVLDKQQVQDLWNAVSVGMSKIPFFIPRDMVLGRLDSGLAEVPPSLRSATVGDVVDQIAHWRTSGNIR